MIKTQKLKHMAVGKTTLIFVVLTVWMAYVLLRAKTGFVVSPQEHGKNNTPN